MSDQCKNCLVRGNINVCLSKPCFHHENWILTAIQAEATRLERARCVEAVEAGRSEFKKYFRAEDWFDKIIETTIDVLLDSIKTRIEAGE